MNLHSLRFRNHPDSTKKSVGHRLPDSQTLEFSKLSKFRDAWRTASPPRARVKMFLRDTATAEPPVRVRVRGIPAYLTQCIATPLWQKVEWPFE